MHPCVLMLSVARVAVPSRVGVAMGTDGSKDDASRISTNDSSLFMSVSSTSSTLWDATVGGGGGAAGLRRGRLSQTWTVLTTSQYQRWDWPGIKTVHLSLSHLVIEKVGMRFYSSGECFPCQGPRADQSVSVVPPVPWEPAAGLVRIPMSPLQPGPSAEERKLRHGNRSTATRPPDQSLWKGVGSCTLSAIVQLNRHPARSVK
jgi:hypothetical protein